MRPPFSLVECKLFFFLLLVSGREPFFFFSFPRREEKVASPFLPPQRVMGAPFFMRAQLLPPGGHSSPFFCRPEDKRYVAPPFPNGYSSSLPVETDLPRCPGSLAQVRRAVRLVYNTPKKTPETYSPFPFPQLCFFYLATAYSLLNGES